MSKKIISRTNSLLSVIRRETTFLRAALFLSVLLLIGNLNAIVDSVLHPEIPYFDKEHIIVGGMYTLLISILFISIGIYFIRQKQSAKMLSESEEKFRALFDSAKDGIFIISSHGSIMSLNTAFAKMHGYTVEEMLTMELKNLDTPESAKLAPVRLQRLFAGEALTFEVEHYCKNGQTISLEVSANSVIIGDENYILGFHRDITERKKAEEALLRSSAELEKSNKELKDALAKVKQLSGLLPICASCKKIRDDKGYWKQIELYITEHTDTLFSHGMCPACEKKAYEELEKLKNKKT